MPFSKVIFWDTDNDGLSLFLPGVIPTVLWDEGEEVAGWLPQLVVGEGGLLVLGEEDAVEGGDLGLPDGVSHSPQGRQHVHH